MRKENERVSETGRVGAKERQRVGVRERERVVLHASQFPEGALSEK